MRSRIAIVMTLALCACLPASGEASKSELAPSALALIEAPQEDDARILFQFALPALQAGYEIQYAEVTFILPDSPAGEEFDLYAVSRSWSPASVGWDNPWTTPGGDFRGERIGSWVTDERTGDLVKFEVTEAVKAFAQDALENYGFIVVAGETNQRVLFSPSASLTMTLFTGPSVKEPAK